MRSKLRIEICILILLLLISLVGEALLLLRYRQPIGSDIQLHLQLVEGWRGLKYPSGPLYPYPPAFHLTIAVLSLIFLTGPLQVLRAMQLVMFPLALLSTFYLVYKKADLYAATLCALLLASSPAFWDRVSQAIPQAVDLFFLPLVVYFFLEDKKKSFVATSTYLVYNHFGYALLPLGGLFLYSSVYQKRFKEFIVIALLALPLIIFMLPHLSSIFAESSGLQTLQEKAVLAEPLFAIKYLGYPLFLLIFIGVIHRGFATPPELEKIAVFWTLSLLPMGVYFPDRLIEYAAQPLAVIGAVVLGELAGGERVRLLLMVLFFLFTSASLLALYSAIIQNGTVYLPLNTLSPFAI